MNIGQSTFQIRSIIDQLRQAEGMWPPSDPAPGGGTGGSADHDDEPCDDDDDYPVSPSDPPPGGSTGGE